MAAAAPLLADAAFLFSDPMRELGGCFTSDGTADACANTFVVPLSNLERRWFLGIEPDDVVFVDRRHGRQINADATGIVSAARSGRAVGIRPYLAPLTAWNALLFAARALDRKQGEMRLLLDAAILNANGTVTGGWSRAYGQTADLVLNPGTRLRDFPLNNVNRRFLQSVDDMATTEFATLVSRPGGGPVTFFSRLAFIERYAGLASLVYGAAVALYVRPEQGITYNEATRYANFIEWARVPLDTVFGWLAETNAPLAGPPPPHITAHLGPDGEVMLPESATVGIWSEWNDTTGRIPVSGNDTPGNLAYMGLFPEDYNDVLYPPPNTPLANLMQRQVPQEYDGLTAFPVTQISKQNQNLPQQAGATTRVLETPQRALDLFRRDIMRQDVIAWLLERVRDWWVERYGRFLEYTPTSTPEEPREYRSIQAMRFEGDQVRVFTALLPTPLERVIDASRQVDDLRVAARQTNAPHGGLTYYSPEVIEASTKDGAVLDRAETLALAMGL